MEIITREEAIKIGQKWFFTGEPCSEGHIDKKSVSRWGCYQCKREYKKEYAIKNPKIVADIKKREYIKNIERVKAYNKAKYPDRKSVV